MTRDPLADDLMDAVGSLSTRLRLRFAAAGPPDVGFVALATIRHLVRRGPTSVTELARADRVTTQAISLRVRPLLDAGLVARGSDETDGRRTLLRATPAGRKAVSSAEHSSRRALAEAISALPKADRAALSLAVPALLGIGRHLDEATR